MNRIRNVRRAKTRRKTEFYAALSRIARRIIGFAEYTGAGITFEKLFPDHCMQHRTTVDPYGFSFENGSFVTLLRLVEKRARSRGIPVLFINAANTSKRCSGCGSYGRRVRKRFTCKECGLVIHADVNAALNIADAPSLPDKSGIHRIRMSRRKARKRAEQDPPDRTVSISLPTVHPALTAILPED